MNKNLLPIAVTTSLGLVLFAGCESDRSRPQGAPVVLGEVRGLVRERPLDEQQILAKAAAAPPAAVTGRGWRSMFDGESLAGWRITKFAGGGDVECRKGLILLSMGDPFTGINWTNGVPKINYEVSLEAMRVAGSDFFCGLTFPVGDSFCSLIVGGWGGSLVGLSSLDGMDASENETTQFISFEDGRWYHIRVRVTEPKIEAWIEQKKIVDVVITGRRVSLRPGDIELSAPFGIASWMSTAGLREIKTRPVDAAAKPDE